MIYPDWNELDDGAEDPDIIKTLSSEDGAWKATTGIRGNWRLSVAGERKEVIAGSRLAVLAGEAAEFWVLFDASISVLIDARVSLPNVFRLSKIRASATAQSCDWEKK